MDTYAFLKDGLAAVAAAVSALLVGAGAYWRLVMRIARVENDVQRIKDQRGEDVANAKESQQRVERELATMSATMRSNFDTLLTEIRTLRGGR